MYVLIGITVVLAFAAVGEYMIFTKKISQKDQEIQNLKYKLGKQ